MFTLLFAFLPLEIPLSQDVDLIELNHVYDEFGNKTFDQIIFWDWKPIDSVFRVRAWRLQKHPSQIPIHVKGGYVATWFDGETFRRIRAKHYRESWTQHDPEINDRSFIPQSERQGLLNRSPP